MDYKILVVASVASALILSPLFEPEADHPHVESPSYQPPPMITNTTATGTPETSTTSVMYGPLV